MRSPTDSIRKFVVLRAPRERVWRAISDAQQFGSWFGARFDGAFTPGARLDGAIEPTTVDPEIARRQEPHRGMRFVLVVERVEPMRLVAFRWHPYAIDEQVDYSQEPMTLIELELEDAPGGTRITITESGFDSIPLARRAQAFEADAKGWEAQLGLVAKFVEQDGETSTRGTRDAAPA